MDLIDLQLARATLHVCFKPVWFLYPFVSDYETKTDKKSNWFEPKPNLLTTIFKYAYFDCLKCLKGMLYNGCF